MFRASPDKTRQHEPQPTRSCQQTSHQPLYAISQFPLYIRVALRFTQHCAQTSLQNPLCRALDVLAPRCPTHTLHCLQHAPSSSTRDTVSCPSKGSTQNTQLKSFCPTPKMLSHTHVPRHTSPHRSSTKYIAMALMRSPWCFAHARHPVGIPFTTVLTTGASKARALTPPSALMISQVKLTTELMTFHPN